MLRHAIVSHGFIPKSKQLQGFVRIKWAMLVNIFLLLKHVSSLGYVG